MTELDQQKPTVELIYKSKGSAGSPQRFEAQPEQEPNWAWICNECGAQEFTLALCKADLDYLACSGCGSNEFHKEALAQEQEPVAWRIWSPDGDKQYLYSEDGDGEPLYTHSQRTWVGLTGEEAMDVTRKEGHELLDYIYEYGTGVEGVEERIVAICKAIESTLKQKNGFAEEKNT